MKNGGDMISIRATALTARPGGPPTAEARSGYGDFSRGWTFQSLSPFPTTTC
jgi:hypothetical protein